MRFEEAVNRFKVFFEEYPTLSSPVYYDRIRKAKLNNQRSLQVDFEHILDFDFEMAQLLIADPNFVVPASEAAFEQLYAPREKCDLHVRFFNVTPARVEIRDLRSEHINKLVQIDGIVRRTTEVKPEIIEAVFTCVRCGQLMIIEQDVHIFKRPTICQNPACGRPGPFKLEEDQSKFVDWQLIKIQERPERLRGGQMPRDVDCFLHDDIVDMAIAGNRVTIAGILKTIQEVSFRGQQKTTFKISIDVGYVELKQKEVEDVEITEEDEAHIKLLASEPFVCDKVVNSIAPAVYGHLDVKEALALQLFSGVMRILPDGTRLRGDSNVLLVGDPGVAKSQLLMYIARIAPRGIYTSGKGTSAAGLTATVVRDETTGGWALEAGALVIADGGIACIDEIDKMSKDDRSSIHEAMEQQTISIAKAGIVATLNARASILAAANPKYGRFDRFRSLVEQIDLPPTLLSRFDLVYILTDKPSEELDRRIAEHIIATHENPDESISPPVPIDLLEKYILYSKNNVRPAMTREASKRLLDFYLEMRKGGEAEEAPLPITARQLEALIRLSEARSRMRLSDRVTREDAEEVIRLFRECLFKVAIDHSTGKLDIDVLTTGKSKSQRDKVFQLLDLIEKLDKENSGNGASEEEIYKQGMSEGLSAEFIRENISQLKRKGDLYSPKDGLLKSVREY
jgi:replicative DNA helicase Mcm